MTKNWNWTKNDQQTASRGNVPAKMTGTNLMSPTTYLAPLTNVYQDMDRIFNQAFRNFGLPTLFSESPLMGMSMPGMMFSPKVDISSTDNEYTIEVEAPGLSENDIRLEVSRDGKLCICGEKRLENDKQEKDFHRVERAYGSFSRTLSLPEDVDQENIEAEFKNGVLTITAPRLESRDSQPRRIDISANNNGDQNERESRRQNQSDQKGGQGEMREGQERAKQGREEQMRGEHANPGNRDEQERAKNLRPEQSEHSETTSKQPKRVA